MYDAIMKAADWIEKKPELYDFTINGVPPDCGSTACALGWIGYFAKIKGGKYCGHFSQELLEKAGLTTLSTFLARMNKISSVWHHDTDITASALRLYAKKYHGDDEQTAEATA